MKCIIQAHLGRTETGKMAAVYAAQLLSVSQEFETRVRAYDRSLHTLTIGFCAPIPQTVLTPIINNTFEGMTPDSKYLLQVEDDSFFELASNSDYPIFSSSYFINRGKVFPDRINIPIADPECSADYYLVCLASEKNRYEPLFKHIHKDTIK